MKVSDLTVDELRLITKLVHEALHDLVADPDEGLELTDEIQARLQSSLGSANRMDDKISIARTSVTLNICRAGVVQELGGSAPL